jgi:hypothetical protein
MAAATAVLSKMSAADVWAAFRAADAAAADEFVVAAAARAAAQAKEQQEKTAARRALMKHVEHAVKAYWDELVASGEIDIARDTREIKNERGTYFICFVDRVFKLNAALAAAPPSWWGAETMPNKVGVVGTPPSGTVFEVRAMQMRGSPTTLVQLISRDGEVRWYVDAEIDMDIGGNRAADADDAAQKREDVAVDASSE